MLPFITVPEKRRNKGPAPKFRALDLNRATWIGDQAGVLLSECLDANQTMTPVLHGQAERSVRMGVEHLVKGFPSHFPEPAFLFQNTRGHLREPNCTHLQTHPTTEIPVEERE